MSADLGPRRRILEGAPAAVQRLMVFLPFAMFALMLPRHTEQGLKLEIGS